MVTCPSHDFRLMFFFIILVVDLLMLSLDLDNEPKVMTRTCDHFVRLDSYLPFKLRIIKLVIILLVI
jgi:hypothetical protein